MKKAIYKYPVILDDKFELEMPGGGSVLNVQMQDGSPFLWAIVEPGLNLVKKKFVMVGTGHEYKEEYFSQLRYINTFQVDSLVLHLFEVDDYNYKVMD